MLQTCKCGKEFLTEADAYVIIPIKDYEANCGRYFTKQITQLKKEIDKWKKIAICSYAHVIDVDGSRLYGKDFTIR